MAGPVSARLLATCNTCSSSSSSSSLWAKANKTGNNRLLTNDSPSGLWGCLLVLSTLTLALPNPLPSRVLLSLFEIQIDMNCWPVGQPETWTLKPGPRLSHTIDTYSESGESKSKSDSDSDSAFGPCQLFAFTHVTHKIGSQSMSLGWGENPGPSHLLNPFQPIQSDL